MAAMMIWGKGFKKTEATLPSGDVTWGFSGIGGGQESIAWSSIKEMMSLTERYGVNKDTWPVYPDCDVESEAPVEDAVQRSAELRVALERVDSSVVEADYWLRFVHKILSEGNCFFVMV
jgi:hypothetical protein